MEQRELMVGSFKTLDNICLYAINEDCVSSGADFPIYNPDLTIEPLAIPTTTFFIDHILFPQFSFYLIDINIKYTLRPSEHMIINEDLY